MKTGADRTYSTLRPKRGWSWETPPEQIPEARIQETQRADVVIVGGGISGLAAAARCSQLGLSVLCIDKSDTQSAPGSQIGVADSPLMRQLGVSLDKEAFARDWMAVSGSRMDEALLWLFLNRSGEVIPWLLELAGGNVEFRLHTGGYKGPGFSSYPGTHLIFKKTGSARYTSESGGRLICEILEDTLTKNGGVLLRGQCARQLELDDMGRVSGVIASDGQGIYRRYAGHAVILATGGIGGNREMLEAFCPLGLKPSAPPCSAGSGDGQKMAYWAGAALDAPHWTAALHTMAHSRYTLFFLHVNRLGKRFMNEDTWMQAKALRCLMQPGGDMAYTIMDSRWLEDYGQRFSLLGGEDVMPAELGQYGSAWEPAILSGYMEEAVRSGLCTRADTLEELAEQIQVPAIALRQTVERYNTLADQGHDADFGKRGALLTSIRQPPFYALQWGPGLIEVFGGAKTDTALHVLNPHGKPVPGLFATGSMAGGFYGVDYPLQLGGNSYGRALTWALVLAETIQRELQGGA